MKYKMLAMNKFYRHIEFPKNKEIYGIYHSSDWSPIPGYNNKVFMVVFNLDYKLYSPVDFLDYQEYAKGCVQALNGLPKNKRDKSPMFGQLTYFKSKVLTHATGNKYIQVFALTNEKKNKSFFRLGDAIDVVPSLKERKNPTTETVDEYIDKKAQAELQAPKKRGRPKKTDEQKAADIKRKENIKAMKNRKLNEVAASWKTHADKEKRKRGRPAKNKKEK